MAACEVVDGVRRHRWNFSETGYEGRWSIRHLTLPQPPDALECVDCGRWLDLRRLRYPFAVYLLSGAVADE